MTIVTAVTHTSTHGAFGALAMESAPPRWNMYLRPDASCLWPQDDGGQRRGCVCRPGDGQDIILAVIAKIGTGGGQAASSNTAGSAIESLSMEGRMTICNMSIEAGAAEMVAPTRRRTVPAARRYAPAGEQWDAAVARLGPAAHR